MNASKRDAARFLALGLMLLALISSISSHGAVSLSLPVQRDSLALTVNPDRSVRVAWNTTTSLGTLVQNITKYFTASYAIHYSSNFSQRSNAVVQTSTIQYRLPPPDAGIFSSISLTATRTGLSSSGSLNITSNVPASTITAFFSTSPTKVKVNATAQLHFSQTFYRGTFLENRTAFQAAWDRTFGSAIWTKRIVSQIQNDTLHLVTVTAFNAAVTYPTALSANVKVGFVAVPSEPATDFVMVLDYILAPIEAIGPDQIIRAALNLQTGETVNLTYNGSTYTVTLQSTTTYVSDLDSQLNMLKSQFLGPLLTAFPAGPVHSNLVFLNSTSITISQMSTTSDIDPAAGTSSMSLKGLLLEPPTTGSSTNFTIPGLFHLLGKTPTPGVNFTLIGGSDSRNQVKIVVPEGTAQPSSTTSNSATWTNLRDPSILSAVEFQVQPLPKSPAAFLVSPAGIAIELIGAITVVAAVALYMMKRRSSKTPLPMTSGLTASFSLGLRAAPATPESSLRTSEDDIDCPSSSFCGLTSRRHSSKAKCGKPR